MRLPSPLLFALLALAALLGTSCSDTPKFRSLCSSDQQCIDSHDGNPNWACDRKVGDCACTADAACMEQEHCEQRPGGSGKCHPNRSCDWNQDCEGRSFCDTASGFCRQTGCDVDSQCDLGNVCDRNTKTCMPGCRSHGDCATQGDVCLCSDGAGNPVACSCDETTEEGRALCQTGVCTSDTCADDTFCKYGEICVDPEPGGTLMRCIKDERGPFCDACELSVGTGQYRCGTKGANFCLQDTTTASGSFCGVDCSNDESCPNGFECRDVRVVFSKDACSSDAACGPSPSAPTCTEATVTEDCPPGARCVDGRCASWCAVSEGGSRGYCGCITDDDCAKQTCGVGGECTITGQRCASDADCSSGPNAIRCEHVPSSTTGRSIGRCWIGRNCAMEEGITCRDVHDGRGPLTQP